MVKQLRQDVEVVSRPLDNKLKLIAGCGEIAALLLHENCQRVVIVWDSRPPWSMQEPIAKEFCLHEEREGILMSLKKAGVTSKNVYLVCIREELEAWLIADNRAIAKAISRLTNRKKPRIAEEKNPESVEKPKSRLINIFKQYTHGPYQEHLHALKIVKELKLLGFNKIKRCETFKRFALKATDTKL